MNKYGKYLFSLAAALAMRTPPPKRSVPARTAATIFAVTPVFAAAAAAAVAFVAAPEAVFPDAFPAGAFFPVVLYALLFEGEVDRMISSGAEELFAALLSASGDTEEKPEGCTSSAILRAVWMIEAREMGMTAIMRRIAANTIAGVTE